MQKKKQVFTWPLSTLVIVVSFLSVLVILKQVQAAWVEPYYLPSDTSLVNNFVFTPLAQNLDLGSSKITKTSQPNFILDPGGTTGLRVGGSNLAGNFDGNVNVTGNLTVTGTINGSGGGGGGTASSDWLINTGASNALYYTTSTGSGNVGIGTNTPNKLLHLYNTSQNAELDIQSVSGAGNHWAIYNDAATGQLRFWKSAANDILTLSSNGRVAVGTSPDNNNMIRTTTATAGVVGVYGENSATDLSYMLPPDFTGVNPNNVGIKGVANNNYGGGTGVYGSGFNGVKGLGFYGLYGEAITNGTGLLAKQGVGSRAALLQGQTDVEGLLKVTGNIQIVGSSNFILITSGIGAPTASCALGGTGKMYFDSSNFRLYVCTGSTGWKSTLLN